MFSQTVEYALRAVVYLAGQEEARTTQQIAAVTKVPSAYLAKALQNLNRAGLVRSQRGLHGGFSLGKSSSELTVWAVVQAVEPIRRYKTCPLELESHKARLCPLHKKLDDALAAIEKAFVETTLADILAEPTTSKPLCPFPYPEEEAQNGRISLK
jgi:Rrf2 family transcriptional regulator, nitric oxide-sensitive transcriptional repressor